MKTKRRTFGLVAALSSMAIALPLSARADDVASAETLFQEGRELMEAHNFAEACPKLAASEKLAPAVGTLLNLADCYARDGKTASAWTTFLSAKTAAEKAGRADRAKVAADRAAALEPTLSKLTIRPAAADPSLTVTFDGAMVEVGISKPVDPGSHLIEAAAPGKKSWSETIDVQTGVIMTTVIPVLDDVPATPAVAPTIATAPKHVPTTQKYLGFGAIGVGAASAVVGTIFGARALSQWASAKDDCQGNLCNSEGVSRASSASASGNISTASFIVSGVLVAGGAVLVLTAPSSNIAVGVAPSVAPRDAGIVLRAAF